METTEVMELPWSPWQLQLPAVLVKKLSGEYGVDLSELRMVCRNWERACNDTVTTAAPQSMEQVSSLRNFKQLKALHLDKLPFEASSAMPSFPAAPGGYSSLRTPRGNPRRQQRTPRTSEITFTTGHARVPCQWCPSFSGPEGFQSWDGFKDVQELSLPPGCCDSCLGAAASRFPDVANITFSGEQITDKGLEKASNLPLAEIHIRNAWNITDDGMKCLAEHGGRLTKLVIHGADQITDEGVTGLARRYERGQGPQMSLQVLALSSCSQIKGEGLGDFPALKSLTLSHCKHVTDLALHDIRNLQELRVLRLSGCLAITDVGIEYLRGLNLHLLDLQDCERLGDTMIAKAVSHMRHLRLLVLAGLTRLTDAGLGKLAACAELQKLSLRGCSQVSDAGMAALLPFVENLLWLDVSGCRSLTHKGLVTLSKHLRSLRHLDMANCTGASNQSLAALGAGKVPLRYLNLSACSRINGTGLAALQLLAPTLRTLCVSWCDLNDPAVLQLQGLSGLRNLQMEGCSRVSAMAVTSLMAKLNLSILNTNCCSSVVEKLAFGSQEPEVDAFNYINAWIPPRTPSRTIATQTPPEMRRPVEVELSNSCLRLNFGDGPSEGLKSEEEQLLREAVVYAMEVPLQHQEEAAAKEVLTAPAQHRGSSSGRAWLRKFLGVSKRGNVHSAAGKQESSVPHEE